MDLRTIMNTESAGNSSAPSQPHPSPSQAPRDSSDPIYPPRDQLPSSSSYPSAFPGPPPPQRSHASPERSSSYGSLQSPYQYRPSPAIIPGAPSQRAPTPPPYGASVSRDSFAASVAYNQQQQQQQQQSPVAQQRSQSIQSVLTPYSHSSNSFHPRESSPTGAAQPYPSQHFSPPAQGSLPNTPRGSAAAIYAHQSPQSSVRPQSSGRDSLSNRASSPWVGPDAAAAAMHVSPSTAARSSRAESRTLDQTPRKHSSTSERRESDESVSPRTTFLPGARSEATTARPDQTALSQPEHVENGTIIKEGQPTNPSLPTHQQHINSSPSSRMSITKESSVEDSAPQWAQKARVASDPKITSSPQQPKRKRRRLNEPPIYAQRCARSKGRCPPIPKPHPPIPKHARDSPANPWIVRQRAVSSAQGVVAAAVAPPVKVKGESTPVNGPSTPTPQRPSEPPQVGSLGPWEPSITGFIPHEEVTKIVADFLFQHVVLRNDAIAAPAGAAAAGQMPIIEVEAKLGQLIDMDRGERMVLPILTETVVNKDNPRFRTAFESTMTVAQHRAMNNFLNEAVKMSMPQSNQGRIPLSYAHKKERDTFYEVSPNELPPVIRQNLNPRHKPKVRVTVDQRTGEVLAKIVKCRIADLDVHSPRTCVDWRISVNLEMSYDGDVSNLPVADGRGGRGGDRNKDRMSYRHLAYQIDLTQVAKSEPPVKGEFEHELEVEISAAEIRRQGQMAMTGDPKNQYEELIKGFVDNVRVLARAVPP